MFLESCNLVNFDIHWFNFPQFLFIQSGILNLQDDVHQILLWNYFHDGLFYFL